MKGNTQDGNGKLPSIFFFVMCAMLAGCSKDKNGRSVNEMRWQESVSLASGEKIAVKRHVEFRQEGALGMGLMAQELLTASLEIVPAPGDFKIWSAPIIPILLDRDPANGEWIVIGAHDGLALWEFNGKPCPPQWGFRLHRGVWYIQPIPINLIGRKPNLLLEFHVTDDANISPDEFVPIAIDRKMHQEAILEGRESNNRIRQNMMSVGVASRGHSSCAAYETPIFTERFHPERAPDYPNLANFPRLP